MTLQDAIQFIDQQQSEKERDIFLDVWVDARKISNKEQYEDLDDLESVLSDKSGFVRIRVYWKYGSQPFRHLQEFSFHLNPASEIEAIPNATLGNIEPEPREYKAPTSRTDPNNPLSWILEERTEALKETKSRLQKMEDKVEHLREEKEKLEREIIKKDTIIDKLNDEVDTPKGLNGFFENNPGVAEKAIEVIGPSLANLLQPQPQSIEGGAYTETASKIAAWVSSQADDIQQNFGEAVYWIIQRFNSNPEFLIELIDKLKLKKEDGTTQLRKTS